MKTVDTHAHIFAAGGPVVAGARYQPTDGADVETYLSHLNRHGLDHGVLIQPSFLGYDNSQMLAAIATHPHRLKGVAVVPVDIDTATLRTLGKQGIVGARLNLFGQTAPDLRLPQWRQFLSRLDEQGWQLELHCPPAYLRTLLPALRGYAAPVVIDHFGRVDPDKGTDDPDYRAVLDMLDPARHWVKVSGYYRLGDGDRGRRHAHQALRLLLDRGLRDHLVWGSDWPHTQYTDRVHYDDSAGFLDSLLPDAGLREQILGANARTLFGFAP
ncbi:amidohydrolase family protein [Castellaniella sp. MT123]|uniref:amidohydrolase family protein n=1 Tax=Castellaniella sp. MT123 TaxID=3140381 RepID=UPI0031F40CFF